MYKKKKKNSDFDDKENFYEYFSNEDDELSGYGLTVYNFNNADIYHYIVK